MVAHPLRKGGSIQSERVAQLTAEQWLSQSEIFNIWRVIEHYVETARTKEDFADVNRIGMDETSRAKGHKYVSVFVDFDKSKVIFATPGKDASTVERFAVDLVQPRSGKLICQG